MTKRIVIPLLLCAAIILAGCQVTPPKNPEPMNLTYAVQYIRTNGYTSGISYPAVVLIRSTEELYEYYALNRDTYDLERKDTVYSDTTIGFLDAVDKYTDDYFKDYILVFVLVEEGSGSIRHEVTAVNRLDDQLEISVKRIVPDIGTDDMAEWHIMVELKKDTYKNLNVNLLN
jgi:hypothetical protein